MKNVHQWLHRRWAVPVISGILILASAATAKLGDAQWPADLLMTAAAAVAGVPIVMKAVRALMARVIGIASPPRPGHHEENTGDVQPRSRNEPGIRAAML